MCQHQCGIHFYEAQVPFNRKNILRNNAVSMTAAMVQVVQIAPLPSSMA
jgi:hypothetical protein